MSLVCAKGYKMGADCEQCVANKYKDQVSDADTCIDCATDTSTNGVTGVTSASNCGNFSSKFLLEITLIISRNTYRLTPMKSIVNICLNFLTFFLNIL